VACRIRVTGETEPIRFDPNEIGDQIRINQSVWGWKFELGRSDKCLMISARRGKGHGWRRKWAQSRKSSLGEIYFKILFQAKMILLRVRYSEDSQTVIGRDCFVLLSFLV
jgi:hypothetical protein